MSASINDVNSNDASNSNTALDSEYMIVVESTSEERTNVSHHQEQPHQPQQPQQPHPQPHYSDQANDSMVTTHAIVGTLEGMMREMHQMNRELMNETRQMNRELMAETRQMNVELRQIVFEMRESTAAQIRTMDAIAERVLAPRNNQNQDPK